MVAGLDWGFLAGAVSVALPTLGFWMKFKQSREQRAQDLFDKVMEKVHAENAALKIEVAALRYEVEACKKRDNRMLTIESCFRLMIPEMIRLDPKNMTLLHVSMLLRSLPLEDNTQDFNDLLTQIDRAEAEHANH